MPATYEPIATTTFSGSTSEVTFSSIAASWTDLRLTFVGTSASQALAIQFNSDTSTNYSKTVVRTDAGGPSSFRNSSLDRIIIASLNSTPLYVGTDIFSYASSSFKTVLIDEAQDQSGSGFVNRSVALWRSTSAITSIRLYGYSGSNITGTATLYGIKNA